MQNFREQVSRKRWVDRVASLGFQNVQSGSLIPFILKIDLALWAVMCGVDEHVHEHGSAAWIGAALRGGQMPFAFELLRCDLGHSALITLGRSPHVWVVFQKSSSSTPNPLARPRGYWQTIL